MHHGEEGRDARHRLAVRDQDLLHLLADAVARVEGGGGVLRHVGDPSAARAPAAGRRHVQHVEAVDRDRARRNTGAAAGMPEERERRACLARPRFADQTKDLASRYRKRHVVDDLDAGARLNAQPFDPQHRDHVTCLGPRQNGQCVARRHR
jgi:hypothetical protein